MELPLPDSDEVRRLIRSRAGRAIYGLLYAHQDEPLTMLEMRLRLETSIGPQEQLDRRRRELNPYFNLEKVRKGNQTAYRLAGLKARAAETIETGISEKDRAAVLQYGRCAMCGKTPLDDGVKLQVDHKVPKEWGGTDDLENLQPLCEQCNRGKKNLFATYNEHSHRIRQAIGYEEPHKRIGELLKAFAGQPVSSELLGLVASAVQYQEDWQKRLRELRILGWNYTVQRRREDGRVKTYYILTAVEPWPVGNIRQEIARREKARKANRGP